MKTLGIAAVVVAAVALSGCARTAGAGLGSAVYGEAMRANFAAQQAYGEGGARLHDLSREFQANTDEVVTFAFDQSSLDATARRALDGQARWLREHPEVRMTIIGNTDLVGTERYNYGLGLRRAKRVLEYLVAHGVSRNLLEAVESKGEEDPVVPTEQRERRNRRAVTTVGGFAPGYVGFGLDGEYAQRIYNVYQAGQVRITEAKSTDVN